MIFTDDEAIFVEAPEEVEVWQNRYGSFHKVAQYNHATYLIRMPLWAFYKLSEEVGDPPVKIIFAEFVPRSGSTLMCQLFEATGKCVVFSEPSVVMYSTIKKDFDSEGAHWRACLRMLCKPIPGIDVRAYFIKTTVFRENMNQRLEEAIPETKFLFLYRDVSACVRSGCKIIDGLPALQQIFSKN
jgi:hypothetical protein